jgi:hypothetical protein
MASLDKPTRWYLLKSLDGLRALRLLAEVLRDATAAGRVHVEENLRCRVRVANYGASVDIWVPETSDIRGPALKTAPAVFDDLKTRFTKLTKHSPEVASPLADAGKLADALPLLLLQPADGAREVAAEKVGDDCLLLSLQPIPAANAAQLQGKIRLHATDSRWAPVDLDKERTFCFWVKDDLQRQSTFGALNEEMGRHGYARLGAWRAGSWLVFLPSTEDPSRMVLELFCEIAQLCPGLFRAPGDPWPTEGPLFALRRHGERLVLFYLGKLQFQEKDFFERGIHEELTVSWHSLAHSDAAKQDLITELKSGEGYRGYRLELTRTEVGSTDAVREQRLEEQIAYLDSRLHLLRTAREPRPTLLRFRQSQLAAFADVLRRTPMKYLQDDRILYGFFAEREPRPSTREGFEFPEYCTHYLWFEPGWVDLGGANPFLNWTEGGEPPRKFWLDPYWARYYSQEQGVNSLVFVPDSHALFPTMHGWTAPEMDGYLRKTLRELLPDHVRKEGLGEAPIYIFDGEASPEGTIEVTLLDRKQFVPFSEKLDWLNDNIRTLDALAKAPETFRQMARSADTMVLAREFEKEAKASQCRMESQLAETREALESQVAASWQKLESVIGEFSKETTEELKRAAKFNQDHDQLRRDLEEATGDAARVLHSVRAAQATGKATDQRINDAAIQIQVQLTAVRAKRDALEHEIAAEIQELKVMRLKLRRMLDDLGNPSPGGRPS